MTAKELANLLDGREYWHELTGINLKTVCNSGLVIVYGESDDLVEFRGAINDEFGAWNGAILHMSADGEVVDDDDIRSYPMKQFKRSVVVSWGKNNYSWFIDSDIPHETFTLYENEEPFCRGIIFDVKDIAMQKVGETVSVIHHIDELGRLAIPKDIRQALDIKDYDELEMTVANNHIIIKKHIGG